MTISLLHPFTPQAVGVIEQNVARYHSQPHVKALQQLMHEHSDVRVTVDYFTPKFRVYNYSHGNIEYRFFPVDFSWHGDHKKWRKQYSKSCLKVYKNNLPDVTIINMSAHSSRFSHQLAKTIVKHGKNYIAMLGGQHYTDTPENRTYYKQAHHILVHTQLQKETMELMPMFQGCDIRVFSLGVEANLFKPAVKKEEGGTIKLLQVCRFSRLKQIELSIEAVSFLKLQGIDVSLEIIGFKSDLIYLKELKVLVKKLSLESQVKFMDAVAQNDLIEVYQNADILLMPSNHESFGMVMVEAMACGLPVVALKNSGGPEELIAHGISGLLCEESTFSRDILNLITSKTLLKSMSVNSRNRAAEKYSLAKTYEILLKSVRDALKLS
ncbi:glycosyltransferase family 4 protein [Aestuariibaculum suncheonense]|uniref:Glycosyltransferase family 4 protein n=1 Tax=Aestuariibaculum suncheonense TaxID=1028745 RepID=A0A8J6UML0_9FLAO|nr:glycosyltransferase family 4 protein [Aestuariibaculum suncheonense]MBD0837031.1 glycosyltransferase family 4 protein [Aestuariibaculum suncheonense]